MDSNGKFTYCNPENKTTPVRFDFEVQDGRDRRVLLHEIKEIYFKNNYNKMKGRSSYNAKRLTEISVNMISKRALALDNFLSKTLIKWNFETDSLLDFLIEEDKSIHKDQLNFFKLIACSIKDKENPFVVNNEGCYLVALWAEFSVAQAIQESNIKIPRDRYQAFSWKDFECVPELPGIDKIQHLSRRSEQYALRTRKRNGETPTCLTIQSSRPKHPKLSATPAHQNSTEIHTNTENHLNGEKSTGGNANIEVSTDLFCRERLFFDSELSLSEALSKAHKEQQQYDISLSYCRAFLELIEPTNSSTMREPEISTGAHTAIIPSTETSTLACANNLIALHDSAPSGEVQTSSPPSSREEVVQGVEKKLPAEKKMIKPAKRQLREKRVEHKSFSDVHSPVCESPPACNTNKNQVLKAVGLTSTIIESSQRRRAQQEAEYSSDIPFTLQYQQTEREIAQSIHEISALTAQIHGKIYELNQKAGKNHKISESEKMNIFNGLLSAAMELNSIEVKKD